MTTEAQPTPKLTWRWFGVSPDRWWLEVRTEHCTVTLQPRPPHCNRGRWLATLSWRHEPGVFHVSEHDFWPRYYFDETRAKLEIEAWLRAHGEIA